MSVNIKELLKKHEEAKEKSIKEMRCVKVHSGHYYYKGHFVSQSGGIEYPWNYGKDELCDYSYAVTKKEAIYNIDLETKGMTEEEIRESVKPLFQRG